MEEARQKTRDDDIWGRFTRRNRGGGKDLGNSKERKGGEHYHIADGVEWKGMNVGNTSNSRSRWEWGGASHPEGKKQKLERPGFQYSGKGQEEGEWKRDRCGKKLL